LQGVLVHGVDAGQVDDAEEEDAGSEGNAAVPLTRLVDLLFSDLRILDSLVDLLSELLTVLQLVYQGFVQQQLGHSAVPLRQTHQDVVLYIQQFFFIGCISTHDIPLLLLELRVLQSYKLGKHLIFETLRGDGKVDDRYFHECLGRVMGVWQCGSHEQFETVVVGQRLVSQCDAQRSRSLYYLLQQDGF
jgi:hypothetical protein